jgi:hypothetical protein
MKNTISISSALLILLCAGLIACTKKPAEKMSKETFSKLYAHLMLVSETYPPTTDSLALLKRQKIDSLFSAWNTNEKEFRDMVAFYQQSPGEWPAILHRSGQELDSLKKRSD